MVVVGFSGSRLPVLPGGDGLPAGDRERNWDVWRLGLLVIRGAGQGSRQTVGECTSLRERRRAGNGGGHAGEAVLGTCVSIGGCLPVPRQTGRTSLGKRGSGWGVCCSVTALAGQVELTGDHRPGVPPRVLTNRRQNGWAGAAPQHGCCEAAPWQLGGNKPRPTTRHGSAALPATASVR